MAAIFPSQPFEERLLLLSWKRLTSLASRQRSRTSVRPRARDLRILDSCSASGPYLSSCFRSLGRSPTVTLRAFHHFECTDPSFSTRCGDFGYERFVGSNGRIPEAGSQLAIIIGRSVSLDHFYNPSSPNRSTGCSFIARYWANLATQRPAMVSLSTALMPGSRLAIAR